MSLILDYIKDHPDWKTSLKKPPYNLQIAEEGDLHLFKYNQIESDFSIPLVREARGIIIDVERWRVVCWPFDKFFNYGESLADSLDMGSLRVESKIDGSIIKLWHNSWSWNISTNGTINAFNTETPGDPRITFGNLVLDYFESIGFSPEEKLNKEFTYIFELVSKWNRIVVSYPETKLYHIGTRSNSTGREYRVNIGIEQPKVYPLNTMEEIIEASKDLPISEEGYVVVDKNFHRQKVKSPLYLAVHRLKGQTGFVNLKRLLDLIRLNETSEFLSYFPEYTEDTNYLQKMWDNMLTYVNDLQRFTLHTGTRKEVALQIQEEVFPEFQGMAFGFLSKKVPVFEKVTVETLEKYFKES